MILLLILAFILSNCCDVADSELSIHSTDIEVEAQSRGHSKISVNFQYRSTIDVGGETAAEISAYDPITKKLFVVNVESTQISVYSLTNLDNPIKEPSIDLSSYGEPNSIDVKNGLLAVAVEAPVKQEAGSVLVYNTDNQTLTKNYSVGAMPDMVIFTKDGHTILSANEGEPTDNYLADPNGTVSLIDLRKDEVRTLDFTPFNDREESFKQKGLRIFGRDATLAQDLEPEYIAVSENSRIAWVSLQENNGIARINIPEKRIEAIFPLGFKDYSMSKNSFYASDDDGIKELKNWPVYGMYQPDALVSEKIGGVEYLFSANEGDAREYEALNEVERIEDIVLDPNIFPKDKDLQTDATMGRLEVTTKLGDLDNDGEYEELYSFGARSFSVWSPFGELIYDSGNNIAEKTLELTPERFNNDNNRSNKKGAEPEAVEVLNISNERYILFVGLERNDQVLVYDVTEPSSPRFLSILSNPGDEAPEGILAVPSHESPTGNDLLIVSYEVSGTISFFENI